MSIEISEKNRKFIKNWEIDGISWICNTVLVDFKTNTEIS